MYKHILIPTDGSELSAKAVESGTSLARSLGAKVTYLYVQPDFPLPLAGEGAMLAPESREEFAQGTGEQAQRVLDAAQASAKAQGVENAAVTEISDLPYEVIIATAAKEGCDLVFMASHGRKGLAGLLIGSETHKVLSHCKVPVLVYR